MTALTGGVERALERGLEALGEGDDAALTLGALPTGGVVAIDRRGTFWIAPDGEAPVAFGPGSEGRFVEVLEVSRREFDDLLERGGAAAGLPIEELLVAFPAVALIRAVLAMSSGYTARLALRWILPSERAELVPAIAALTKNGDMPQDVRDLARHLAR